jgi:hypothetical protein
MTDVTALQTRLDALKKARASGVLTVRHGDTQTTFRSLDEIDRIIASLEAEIASASGTPRRRVRYIYQAGKGL